MKIIVSHDVDHLYVSDHYFKDLIVEKFIIRGFVHFIQRRIDFHTLMNRLGIVFTNRMNNIDSLMVFDAEMGVPSTFFFGMANGLGMSYSIKRAVPFIKKVKRNGFDAGVHGIEYESAEGIAVEHDRFKEIVKEDRFGIRNHYVRFDDDTFSKMDAAGYLFDSTQFNKKATELVNPYKIGNMWEFPLHIMDVYACKSGDYREDVKATYQIVEEAEKIGIKYFTLLFHEEKFNRDVYPEEYNWYVNLIGSMKERGYEFVSYNDAIRELENE